MLWSQHSFTTCSSWNTFLQRVMIRTQFNDIPMPKCSIRLALVGMQFTACLVGAPNDTAYTRWSCHSGLANHVQIVSTPTAMWGPIFWASMPYGPAVWLAMLFIKAGDVENNPGPTTTHKQVWICGICHRQIQVRKQISIRCNRIEHWVHQRCAGIRLAQYTDTWTCHQHRESILTIYIDFTLQDHGRSRPPTLPQHHPHHRNQNTDTYPTFPIFLQNW